MINPTSSPAPSDVFPGCRVRLVSVFGSPLSPEMQVDGVVTAVRGDTLEVVHEADGGGFDFWPLDEVVLGDEHGIVWESGSRRPESGIAIFATPDARDAAVQVLAEDLGYRYFTDYADVHGYGLSYAAWHGVTSRESARAEHTRNRRSYR